MLDLGMTLPKERTKEKGEKASLYLEANRAGEQFVQLSSFGGAKSPPNPMLCVSPAQRSLKQDDIRRWYWRFFPALPLL